MGPCIRLTQGDALYGKEFEVKLKEKVSNLLEQRNASKFPLMVVTSIVYPCNFGCPNCPYTDENSDLRQFYREKNKAERLPRVLWEQDCRRVENSEVI